MKPLILASQSPQRKKLMKLLGVPFKIKPSRAEEIHRPNGSCRDLVKENALLKAQDVARRLKEGLVIGADTLVALKDGTIIGKPRSMAEAKARLKDLFHTPSFVFTGVAVIDCATQKKLVGCEKTKVFMEHLDDAQIDRYYAQVSPLDKAGGFDIEGKGSHFIRRIEGCYFNVVGLPIARLVKMLKKFGVQILSVFFMLSIIGCATEYNLATERQETLLFGTGKEISLGDNLSALFDKEFEINQEIDVNQRILKIARRIFEVSDRQELVYTVKVINDDKVNAVSLPGGYIYIYKGLIDAVKNDDQLACVIGHEVGHITAKHGIKKLQALYGYNFLKVLTIATGGGQAGQGLDLAFASIFSEFSQADEFEADRLGLKYAKAAGYSPAQMAQFLKILKDIHAKEPSQQISYWRTHPYTTQRIAAVNKELSGGQIEFKDYLNLTGE